MIYSTYTLTFILLCLIFLCHPSNPRSLRSNDPLVLAFENSPESERNAFVKYFLSLGIDNKGGKNTLGIDSDLIEKFQMLNIPNDSIEKLSSWTKDYFKLTMEGLDILVKQEIFCDTYGLCVSIPDVGGNCCPW